MDIGVNTKILETSIITYKTDFEKVTGFLALLQLL